MAILRGQWLTAILPVVLESALGCSLWLLFDEFKLPHVLVLAFYLTAWTTFVGTLAVWQSGRRATAAEALRRTTAVVAALSVGGLFVYILSHSMQESFWACLSPFLTLTALGEGRSYALPLAVCGGVAWSAGTVLLAIWTRHSLARQ